MRPIIRRLEVVADDVQYPGDAPGSGARTVHSAAALIAGELAAGTVEVVLLMPADEIAGLSPYLSTLRLIVVEFAKIGEGRGFTQARLLRQRFGYSGELRARGALKRDQLFFLARCGFDSFELDPTEDLPAALAALHSFSVAYQDGSDALVQVQRRDRA